MNKGELRSYMKIVRREAHEARALQAAQNLCEVFKKVDLPASKIVSAYWPTGSEVNVYPLIKQLHTAGNKLCLPVTIEGQRSMIFRSYSPDDTLHNAGFGTMAPGPEAEVAEPDVMIVPLLAFDRCGRRLGCGIGHYDETISNALNSRDLITIGVGYAEQEAEAIPVEAHDQALDYIVTDREVFKIRKTT